MTLCGVNGLSLFQSKNLSLSLPLLLSPSCFLDFFIPSLPQDIIINLILMNFFMHNSHICTHMAFAHIWMFTQASTLLSFSGLLCLCFGLKDLHLRLSTLPGFS